MNTLILDRDEERVVVGAEEGVQEGLLVGGVGGGRGQDGEEEEEEIVTNHGDGCKITEWVDLPRIVLDMIIEDNCIYSGHNLVT